MFPFSAVPPSTAVSDPDPGPAATSASWVERIDLYQLHRIDPQVPLADQIGALHRSPVVVPIPGRSRLAHLEENCAAAAVTLGDAELAELTRR